jgi:glycosyltransferase involved in cell wall biosynthesis
MDRALGGLPQGTHRAVSIARVSVVICAYNEERHITRLLRSLQRQSLPPSEVIVVDDGSTDATAARAQMAGAKVLKVDHAGPAAGRNAGAKLATGEILVFVDGDMECARGFLAALTGPIVQAEAVGTFSKEIYVGEPANAWSRAYCYIRRIGYPRLLGPDFPDRWSNFRAIRRDAFLSVGGYDNVGYGEDMTLAPKLGAEAIAVPRAVCWHFNPDSVKEIFENARWIARGHDVQVVAHPVRDNLPHVALARAFRDRRRGAPASIFIARLSYSAGFLIGLAQRRRNPYDHAK